MTKRRKFVLSSLLLSLGLLGIQYIALEYRFLAVFVFFVASFLVSTVALLDDLKGVEWFTIVPFPAIYAASVALFYFLLPEAWWARVFIMTLFGLGMYAIYLTCNIFSVAAVRTIQLLRAAHAVGFLLTLVTLLLIFNTIFSLRISFLLNGLLAGASTFPLMLTGLWSVKLEEKVSPMIWRQAGFISILVLQLALAVSLLPFSVWVASIILVTVVYVGLGLLQHEISERLFPQTLQEYLSVGVFVLLAAIIVTPWK
ncbi:hypothetical protein ACFL1M_00250 [Patescibacteria group bacterium]